MIGVSFSFSGLVHKIHEFLDWCFSPECHHPSNQLTEETDVPFLPIKTRQGCALRQTSQLCLHNGNLALLFNLLN